VHGGDERQAAEEVRVPLRIDPKARYCCTAKSRKAKPAMYWSLIGFTRN